MTTATHAGRRDRRFELQAGLSSIEFDHPSEERRCIGEMLMISVAGLAFKLNGAVNGIEPGTVIIGARVSVGDCALEGDLAVKNATPVEDGGTCLGCLFYPDTGVDETKLMTLLAGMEAVRAQGR
jgi:hypothetical protein